MNIEEMKRLEKERLEILEMLYNGRDLSGVESKRQELEDFDKEHPLIKKRMEYKALKDRFQQLLLDSSAKSLDVKISPDKVELTLTFEGSSEYMAGILPHRLTKAPEGETVEERTE